MRASLLFAAAAALSSTGVDAVGVDTAAVTWGPCPQGPLGGEANECATLVRPLDVDNPQTPGTVNIFMRRYFAGAAATGDSLWMLDGGPGFSAVAFAPIAQYALTLMPTLTVYLLDQRGTGLSTFVSCAKTPSFGWFDSHNATMLAEYDACNSDLAARYANTAQFYSTYSWASDLNAAVNTINPTRVAFYALSYGTFAMNSYLLLPGARADVVLLDGPVPANRWVLENNARWVSVVAQDLFHLCATNSAYCASRIGAMGHLPHLVMDAITDGSLPCLKQLPWLSQYTASIYAASLTLNGPAHPLHAPFWWRLYRCSASDVQQLNFLHNYKTSTNGAPAAPEYSYGLAVLIGSSEVYSYAGGPGGPGGVPFNQQANQTSRQLTDATPQTLLSFARDGGSTPIARYTPNPATAMKFASPKVPVLVLVGTLDPNTPHGLGPWIVDGLGSNARLLTVPYSAHGTVNYQAPCVNSIAFNFLLAFGSTSAADVDTSCMSTIQAPDFDGRLDATQQLAKTYYGTTDLWNAGGPIPTPSPTPAPAGGAGGSNSGYIAAIVLLSFSTVGLGVFAFLLRRRLAMAARGNVADAAVKDYAHF